MSDVVSEKLGAPPKNGPPKFVEPSCLGLTGTEGTSALMDGSSTDSSRSHESVTVPVLPTPWRYLEAHGPDFLLINISQ